MIRPNSDEFSFQIVGVRVSMAAGPAPGLNTLYVHVNGMAVEC